MKFSIETLKYLQSMGITHIASIKCSYYSTQYYHLEAVDDLIANGGKWEGGNGYIWNQREIDWSKVVTRVKARKIDKRVRAGFRGEM